MSPDILIKKLLAQREFWCDLDQGKRVRLRRPAETELAPMLVRDKGGKLKTIQVGVEQVKAYAIDWEGFTEADLITSGASDAVEFAPELWAVVVADRRDWVGKVGQALLDKIMEHEQAQLEASGN